MLLEYHDLSGSLRLEKIYIFLWVKTLMSNAWLGFNRRGWSSYRSISQKKCLVQEAMPQI